MGGVYLRFKAPEKMDKMLKTLPSEVLREIRRYEIGDITFPQLIANFGGTLPGMKPGGKTADILGDKDENIITAIEKLRDHGGLTIGLLSNVGFSDENFSETDVSRVDKGHFDVIVESCRVNLRKPDPRIFVLTAEKVGVTPEECVFLDDLWANCKSAEACGMTAIEVVRGDSKSAVKKLERLLGKELL
ncbi:unnamed protein product [Bursaphelenchus xylophilus]|uniref:(pine wood nematode) hypothetical protein n=1 Tax=Bursaphelenchus xylophilus TaxID=6326 RepID=A0A1I7RYJ9_BURXY|nr:unnamed protein product [Bursaphelenchus xylophilus]CAG9092603.1 unnamed protein product [Bursaphelenchus xylophilus]